MSNNALFGVVNGGRAMKLGMFCYLLERASIILRKPNTPQGGTEVAGVYTVITYPQKMLLKIKTL